MKRRTIGEIKSQMAYITFERNGKEHKVICDVDKITQSLYGTYGLMLSPDNKNFKIEIKDKK